MSNIMPDVFHASLLGAPSWCYDPRDYLFPYWLERRIDAMRKRSKK